jgi:hypothetical protein
MSCVPKNADGPLVLENKAIIQHLRAKLRVPSGAPDHASGGEKFAPSGVYLTGILSPSAKAGL